MNPGVAPAAQDSPLRDWVAGWTGFLNETLPLIFVVVVLAVGLLIMIRRGNKKKGIAGGVKAAIVFGIGAALALLILTSVTDVANFFGDELPLERD